MTDQAVVATLEEGAPQVVEGEATQSTEERSSVLTPRHDARESALEQIAAARRAERSGEQSEEAAAAPAATTAEDGGAQPGGEQTPAVDPNAELAAQIARQLADGKLVLTDELLAKTVVKTKIDGIEEETPAAKVVVQYQKNGAADVRLAEATRVSREAQDLLKKAQETVATATTAAKPEPAATKDEVDADIARLTKEHAAALYNGDDETAASLLGQLVEARVNATLKDRLPAGDTATPVSVDDVVRRALPAMKQQLSVESALAQLKADYPEIYADPDVALLADMKLEKIANGGKPLPEAIAEVGEIMGKQFGFGKHKKPDVIASPATTTRDQKLAAKAGLDEPTSAATRAPSTVQAPMTRAQILAEMQAARGQARAP